MAENHPAEEDLVMLYYRETALVDRGSAEQLREHLAACPSCQAAYQNLIRVLDACDDLPVPEPHPSFESRMWNRLEPQLHPLKRHWSPWAFHRTRWFAVAAVAAMLVLAFVAGRFTKSQSATPRIVAITADGRQLSERKDEREDGYTLRALPNGDFVVKVKHSNGQTINIS